MLDTVEYIEFIALDILDFILLKTPITLDTADLPMLKALTMPFHTVDITDFIALKHVDIKDLNPS
jgi:hypothetical protein